MMHNLPVLEIEEIPMRLDALGRLQFCRMNDEAVLVDFALRITAEGTAEHECEIECEIASIHMGTQELTGEQFRRFAAHFEAEHIGKIYDHIHEHLSDARTSAAFQTHDFQMGAL